ncbi:transposase domain-containing protein, partial [Pseudorhodoplanes sp.]|uniref:transposase domain-containing protein n=1 Tax=Pseudorhodoplanes sp. TaxID=1934341 RepID=UPI003D0FFCA6
AALVGVDCGDEASDMAPGIVDGALLSGAHPMFDLGEGLLDRIEIDSNVVERSIRPIALNRKNALFAGSDGGAEHWAVVASLIETCKLNAIDPQAYLADALTKIVNRHPNSRIDELLPWAYAVNQPLKDVA